MKNVGHDGGGKNVGHDGGEGAGMTAGGHHNGARTFLPVSLSMTAGGRRGTRYVEHDHTGY